ncbi:hypothetical protein [Ureibacillus sp. FSL K6-0165]|uniref:hypothetical protein n=1 Tax=Ureibacillus sp. FSL K6-0165 TaxID=2954606 RepID=UPI0030FB1477
MKEDIINFYKKDLGVWNMVYKNMNRIVLVLFIIFFILLITALIISTIIQNTKLILLVIILLILEGCLLNSYNKKLVEKIHKIPKKDQGFFWGGYKLQKKRSEKLEQYILKKIDTKEQLEKLIDILRREAETRKFSGLFVRGLGIGLFLPLWNYFLQWLFKEVDSVINVVILFISILMIIVLLAIFSFLMKLILLDLFDREARKLNELANMLEDFTIKNRCSIDLWTQLG